MPADNAFDPYRKWLGIPESKRPLTHYALLGISLDEEDHDVIRAAAVRQRSFVERFLVGQQAVVAKRVIVEIDEAEFTLLDPEMRRDYDRRMSLFNKRQKRRKIDPNPSVPRARGGAQVVGEGTGLFSEYAGIMAVIGVCFFGMAAAAFYLPWSKLTKAEKRTVDAAAIPSATPRLEQPPSEAAKVEAPPNPPTPVPKVASSAAAEDGRTPSAGTLVPQDLPVESGWTYLNSLTVTKRTDENGWWSQRGEVVLGGLKGDPIKRVPLVFEGKRSPRGVYQHATPNGQVSLAYYLGRRFSQFRTEAVIPDALDEQRDAVTPFKFKVEGDGRTIWETPFLSKKGDSRSCTIGVSDVDLLTLSIQCPGPSNWALAAWIEPRLQPRESAHTEPSAFDAAAAVNDRNIAKIIQRVGGTFSVRFADGSNQDVEQGRPLPDREFRIVGVNLKGVNNAAEPDLQKLASLTELSSLSLMQTPMTDNDLRHLAGLKKLMHLNVAATKITGSGFRHLSQLDRLEVLLCGGSPIKNESLELLKPLKNLRELGLVSTHVTDSGMKKVAALTSLRNLKLNDTQVTDKGLLQLKSTRLDILSLTGTKVTRSGVADFQKVNPRCQVVF